jgi:hypothetical protein
MKMLPGKVTASVTAGALKQGVGAGRPHASAVEPVTKGRTPAKIS